MVKLLKSLFFFLILFLATNHSSVAQFYNGTRTDFGKNRVQYDDFEWQFYRFQKFETYFYTGGKDLATHTANYVNVKIPELEKFLDFYLSEQIQFIIYNKQSHFRQSNIGLSTDENYNIGGVTRIVGNKVFVYFEGDYELLEKQLDAGIYKVLIYQMIYGGNWREVLRNSALLNLPEWYINGLVSFLTRPNDPLVNARIKDGVLNGDFKRFNSLSSDEATIAGHAMWQYIAETYGENVISNILYMTRISREIDDGFLYVIGIPFENLYEEWISFYQSEYVASANENFNPMGVETDFKIKKNRVYQNFTSDHTGRYQAFNTNKFGQYKIYLYDKEEDKKIKLFQDEHKLDRIQDYSYPMINWHPSGKLLTFITEDKGEVLLHTYNLEEKSTSTKPIFKIEKVLSYDYLKDGKSFVFSGISNGQSDLFLYNVLGNTQRNLTNDKYSDLEPVVSDDGTAIFFVSDRDNDSLNMEHEINPYYHEKDIFAFNLNDEENPIQSVTDSKFESETTPLWVDSNLYYSLQNGPITERFKANYDSAISRIDTTVHYRYFYDSKSSGKYPRNLISQASNDSEKINQISFRDGKYKLLTENINGEYLDISEDAGNKNNETGSLFNQVKEESFLVFDQTEVEKEIDINNYEFSNKNTTVTPLTKTKSTDDNEKEIEPLDFPTQRIYRLNFKTDQSVLQLNNTFINAQYQLFNGGPYINSGIGVNTKIGIVDLMEDHRIYGGFRYAGELIEYSLSYQNLKKRLDKEYMISRTRERVSNTNSPFDVKTLRGVSSFIWPFSEVTSLRSALSARNDKKIFLSSDRTNLERETENEYWASAKIAYVFDNTRNVALNIRYGTRFKIFAEQYQLVYSEKENSTSSDLTVLGFDYRHYQKIHRELIFVGRAAGSTSFGSNPLVYYLGGVDEWWKSDIFDEGTPIDMTQNYGFQALAANMRGFLQNIRNGNNFVVLNSEIRLPVFSYFINRPIQSDFVRNFQIISFADVGTAWTGPSPFDDDNPLNNETRVNGPITVTYENINDPVVGGVGFGLRSTLLGYFVRADWAWGIENGEMSKESQFIFSLSLDI